LGGRRIKKEIPYKIREANGEKRKVFSDPRPDIGSDLESLYFADFLSILFSVNKEAASILHGFRCQGTRLIKTEKGNYVLRPVIGKGGWESQEGYDKAKAKYLEPVRRDVASALKRLR
jgi:hypothetical protein